MKTEAAHARLKQHGGIAPQTLAILLIALAVGAGLWAGQRWFGTPTHEPPVLRGALAYPQPRTLPTFELEQADGSALTAETLRGRWTLVFIGFTHCPDICPTTLAQLSTALQRWDPAAEGEPPQVLFVSVDPERDTPARAGEYARYFDAAFLGASGSHAALEPFARNLGLVYMQSSPAETPAGAGETAEPAAEAGYSVDHSASVAVLDPQARLVALLRPPFDPDVVVSDLRALQDAAP